MTIKKYSLIELQGYADKLFREGKIQVPLINDIQRFIDNFEKYQKGEDKNEI